MVTKEVMGCWATVEFGCINNGMDIPLRFEWISPFLLLGVTISSGIKMVPAVRLRRSRRSSFFVPLRSMSALKRNWAPAPLLVKQSGNATSSFCYKDHGVIPSLQLIKKRQRNHSHHYEVRKKDSRSSERRAINRRGRIKAVKREPKDN